MAFNVNNLLGSADLFTNDKRTQEWLGTPTLPTNIANTSALNTGRTTYGENAVPTESKPSGEEMFGQFLNKFMGMIPQTKQLSVDEQMKINAANVGLGQQDRGNIAKYGKEAVAQRAGIDKETDVRNHGFNMETNQQNHNFGQSDALLQDKLATGQQQMNSNIRRTENFDDFTMGLNNTNQSFENTKSLNAQQSKDNENARKYGSLDNLVNNIGNIYGNAMPANLMSQFFK